MRVVGEHGSRALASALIRVEHLPRSTSVANKLPHVASSYDDYSDSVYVDSPYDDYQDR